ncbi:unnamed protein product [Ostreobium quekettii]|uniref:Membrane protein insertion efficiency factor n=1 Tax=Ostreobium quekettii TaxID=121088 RepID=A0A8S1JD07_9CHLO|nr:unnamed protein product [Ostreobium quekettii]
MDGFVNRSLDKRRRLIHLPCKVHKELQDGSKLAKDLNELHEDPETTGKGGDLGKPYGEDSQEEEGEDSAGVRAALAALRFYKSAISPLLPPSCRYIPTCSEYAMESYKTYGCAKGTVLTAWRLSRCNPFGGRGYDPPQWPPPGLEWIFK